MYWWASDSSNKQLINGCVEGQTNGHSVKWLLMMEATTLYDCMSWWLSVNNLKLIPLQPRQGSVSISVPAMCPRFMERIEVKSSFYHHDIYLKIQHKWNSRKEAWNKFVLLKWEHWTKRSLNISLVFGIQPWQLEKRCLMSSLWVMWSYTAADAFMDY